MRKVVCRQQVRRGGQHRQNRWLAVLMQVARAPVAGARQVPFPSGRAGHLLRVWGAPWLRPSRCVLCMARIRSLSSSSCLRVHSSSSSSVMPSGFSKGCSRARPFIPALVPPPLSSPPGRVTPPPGDASPPSVWNRVARCRRRSCNHSVTATVSPTRLPAKSRPALRTTVQATVIRVVSEQEPVVGV